MLFATQGKRAHIKTQINNRGYKKFEKVVNPKKQINLRISMSAFVCMSVRIIPYVLVHIYIRVKSPNRDIIYGHLQK